MYRKNEGHFQKRMFSDLNLLPAKVRERLENSWANTFYWEFFMRLDEDIFAVLYSQEASRPNVPVNVLVGLETLKAGNGWSDQEMYDAICFDVQVRYALGYVELGEGHFELRTMYNFRNRISNHMQATGENLIEKAFEQIIDEQLAAFQLKTGKQRMDSTQVSSNIREMSRLQLLVEVLQRAHRMLTEVDQTHYTEAFEPYLKGHAGQYVYHIKGKDTSEHLQKIGEFMHRLLVELRATYAATSGYQVLKRVFSEHFRLEEREVQAKSGKELSASSMQSPDDLEATYREKGGKSYQGYVANLTETCDSENPLQLITQIQVEPNTTDDAQMLLDAVPDLKKRTDLDTLYTDGGYGSPLADQVLNDQQVTQIQTAIRGRTPSSEKLHLSDFDIKQNKQGKPVQITCPNGQHVPVQTGSKRKGFVARFKAVHCQACVFHKTGQCPTRPGKRDPSFRLYFSQSQAHVSQRRRRNKEHQKEGRNLRAAVEATVREVKHPFPAGKLPVRGGFRVTCMILASATMTNVRRIQRYLLSQKKQEDRKKDQISGQKCDPKLQGDFFFAIFVGLVNDYLQLFSLRRLCFGC
jgi:hypothetical protein